ncbi:MAG TPA: isoaspartyl peptidase/L-asparaginase [Methylococcus sp.]|nr:isoaspartyl peptidase/L-asparaginase [Methylococcus sp.]
MQTLSSRKSKPPVVLVHGGAGSREADEKLREQRSRLVAALAEETWARVAAGESAVEAAGRIVRELEASPLFNAGRGAVLQSDGLARLSASLMDGKRQKFSGVLLATHLIHPSRLALALQDRTESVLGPLGAQLLARELGLPPENPATANRARQWAERLEKPPEGERVSGTVGAVVLDLAGNLAAATSTGGSRCNFPERVSDSATVAGNYASAFAAISCTGVGEQIVDDGLAVRLETRVRDGSTLPDASERTFREALDRKQEYGWIGVDHSGAWVMYWTTEDMICAVRSGDPDSALRSSRPRSARRRREAGS